MASTHSTHLLLSGGDISGCRLALSSTPRIATELREAGHRVLVCDPARPHIAPTEYDEAIFGESKNGAEPPVIDIDVHAVREGFLKLLLNADTLKIDIVFMLSLIHISEPTRQAEISYAVFCLK